MDATATNTDLTWCSGPELDPREWDRFLARSAQGQFQQSTCWAEAKAAEGWLPLRWALTSGREIRGGFQALVRPSRFGQIAYVSKGPVVEAPEALPGVDLLAQLTQVVAREGIAALIVQPPDGTHLREEHFARAGFGANELVQVLSASLVVDLAGEWGTIEGRMRKTTLKQVRRAERRGVSVREGGEGDVALFFRLMTSTCARQGTLPQPASEAAMLQVWRSFHREGKVRMTFAEVDGEAVATLFCLDFGDRVSAWKKGWSGAHEEKHPNVLLSYEAIQWAHRRGARQFDFMGFDRDAMKQGVSAGDLQAAQQGSLYWFNLGFGSQPRLLPESFLYFGNGLLRAVHRSHLGRALLRLGRAAFLRTLNP